MIFKVIKEVLMASVDVLILGDIIENEECGCECGRGKGFWHFEAVEPEECGCRFCVETLAERNRILEVDNKDLRERWIRLFGPSMDVKRAVKIDNSIKCFDRNGNPE